MVDVSFTIIIQWINFGVLLFLLYQFLYKPLVGFLDKRAETIKGNIDEALNKREESLTVLREYEGKLRGIRSEADAILSEAQKKAEKKRKEFVEVAENESRTIIQAAKKDVTQEIAKAKDDLKKSISSLVITCAEKVLEREVNEEDHKKFLEEFLAQKGM